MTEQRRRCVCRGAVRRRAKDAFSVAVSHGELQHDLSSIHSAVNELSQYFITEMGLLCLFVLCFVLFCFLYNTIQAGFILREMN